MDKEIFLQFRRDTGLRPLTDCKEEASINTGVDPEFVKEEAVDLAENMAYPTIAYVEWLEELAKNWLF